MSFCWRLHLDLFGIFHVIQITTALSWFRELAACFNEASFRDLINTVLHLGSIVGLWDLMHLGFFVIFSMPIEFAWKFHCPPPG